MHVLRRWIREKKEIYLIRKSGWFDKDFYKADYSGKIRHPIRHYIRYGAKEGKNPNSWFDGEYYLKQNQDVRTVGTNPFLHYILFGYKEGRLPNCNENIQENEESLSGYKEWAGRSRKKGIRHYFNVVKNTYYIWKSGEFDGGWYLLQYQDVYQTMTRNRVWRYRNNRNPVLRLIARILTNVCLHYVTKGVYMGYSPNSEFDTVFYMDQNADLCENSEINPFVHYLRYGKSEKRMPGKEEEESITHTFGGEYYTNVTDALHMYRELRRNAILSGVSESEWQAEKILDTILENLTLPRILISLYEFSYGGGEIMPIRLANALWEKDFQVGVHVYNSNECNSDVRNQLNPAIPVIFANHIGAMTAQLLTLDYNIVHTHHQACQSFINDVMAKNDKLNKQICHVATTHGMYENFNLELIKTIVNRNNLANRVSCWTYVADKNILPFKKCKVYDAERFIKIPNGMQEPVINYFDLQKYGIKKEDFVITIVSRAIIEKGWLHAIHAVESLHNLHPEIHLLLVGEGEVFEKYAGKYNNGYIHFLGFQKNPCDIFAVSQLCLLPTYYQSESAPLCIIEAMMCGLPVIATDIGDIREMLTYGDSVAGKIIPLKHGCVDEEELTSAIKKLIEDKSLYASAAQVSLQKRTVYLMDTVIGQYIDVYHKVIDKKLQLKIPENIYKKEKKIENMLWNARQKKKTPKVSVIVPNFNHAKYLKQRLDSIYGQTYQNMEVILLDDCSIDGSQSILKEYANRYPEQTKLVFNDTNSGGVFHQWMKGIRYASGELCWIAESDDYCESNFLESLVPEFEAPGIWLAYTKYVFVNENGVHDEKAFWNYMGRVHKEKWHNSYRNTAVCEIEEGLGIINTIPNASGVIFRNPGEMELFSDSRWYSMKICGDWVFYLTLLKDKNIAYNVGTTSYFRFHSNNSSVKTYVQPDYYKEHGMVADYLWDLYHPDDVVMLKQKEMVWDFYQQNIDNNREQFEQWYGFRLKDKFENNRHMSGDKKRTHILRAIHCGTKNKIVLLNPVKGISNRKPENTLEDNMNMVGKNTGNQVFVEAVKQQVHYVDDVWINPIKVKEYDTDNYVAVMPCSNYIIEGPQPLVRSLLDLYEQTKIPIVPIGLGAQSSKDGNTPRKLVQRLQKHVIAWLKLVSERTVSIGIRGEFTAECLELLGIHNYRIIGCPTAYMYLDGHFRVLQNPSAERTLFTTTAKSVQETKMLEMAIRGNSKWIMQMMTEFPQMLYNNILPDKKVIKRHFPGMQCESADFFNYVTNNAKIFFDYNEWNSYLRDKKFSFAYGSRFHGNMMALRNGIPTLWVTHDSRTSELVDTLHLPHTSIENALKYKMPEELIPLCDYKDFYQAWPGLLQNYIEFLEENGINHRYTDLS